MRKTVLYIAMSLDGFIADKNGGVAWLEELDTGQKGVESYQQFINTVDTVIMGYTTYAQITTELSVGSWPYEGKTTYIMTHRKVQDQDDIMFVNSSLACLITDLKGQDGKNIWICGGAELVNQMLKSDMIDRFHISVVPVILGNGIRLFQKENSTVQLKLLSAENINGMMELVYEKCE